MVAELQTEDMTAIDWRSVESAIEPPPTLRLLAKVPRLNDSLRRSLRELPEPVLLIDGQTMDPSASVVDVIPPERQTERSAQTSPHTESQGILSPSDLVERVDVGKNHPGMHPVASPAISARSSWLSRFCELHETMAPWAGLIVTFALFMSAGLLYWLVLGPFAKSNHSQQPTGMETIGQFSSGPAATTNAPVWSVPRPQPVITEEESAVSEEKSAQSASWQHNFSEGATIAADPQFYPKTHYDPCEALQPMVMGQNKRDRYEIANGPERVQTR